MLIVKFPGTLRGTDKFVGVIGSCRVHNPMKALVTGGRIEMVSRKYRGYTHTPDEALQYLRHARGEMRIPNEFAPFIFSTDTTPNPDKTQIALMQALDCVLVEACASRRFRCGPYDFQANYFSEHFIRPNGVDYLDWWSGVTRAAGNPSSPGLMAAADDLMKKRGDAVRPYEEEILRAVRCQQQTDAEFEQSVVNLVENAGARVILKPHFSFDNNDNAISRFRLENRTLVRSIAERVGAGFFDSSDILLAADRKVALLNNGKDIYHYSPKFDGIVGDKLYEYMVDFLK